MSIKKRIAYKMARLAYSHNGLPFGDTFKLWDIKLQMIESQNPEKYIQHFWHSTAYRLGMWCVAFKHLRKFGDWLVHLVPYNVRFYLA